MSDNTKSDNVIVWDGWIRLFHWSLAGCIVFLILSGKTGFLFFEWHRQIGELVLALILFRILWSMVGSSNTGLLALVVHPRQVISHLLDLLGAKVEPERGHNAAGGWAVLFMLALVSFQAVSGMLIADEDELIEGRFYGLLDESTTETILHLHHLNASIIMGVVTLHILMIGVYWIRAGQNLVRAMITGNMQWPHSLPLPFYRKQQWWIGGLLLIVVLGFVGWLSRWW